MRRKAAPRKQKHVQTHRELLKIEGRAVEVMVRLNPRARKLIVKVHPASGEVSVVMPSERALGSAMAFANGQSNWIARQLAHVPERVALRPGVSIPLRGIDHLIAPSEDGRAVAHVGDDGKTVRIGGHTEHAPRRIVDFLKREARRDIEARLADFSARLGVRPRRISLRDTISRWGSCSSTRSLSFSWRLVLAPPFVLDYVVAHETAHLCEMNHGPKFWKLVRDLVGDERGPQAWLRRHGSELHRYSV
jgi:predicted metal-dependent hydrolase